jgi:hypothetical protein
MRAMATNARLVEDCLIGSDIIEFLQWKYLQQKEDFE